MARFVNFWHLNPSALPTDPSKQLELYEMMWASMDGMIKKGEIEEFGAFHDGYSGYIIAKGETADSYKRVLMFHPYVVSDVHEIIPYEKCKETIRTVLKAKMAAMKKK